MNLRKKKIYYPIKMVDRNQIFRLPQWSMKEETQT